jgi:membrane protease YdiL (CAAX protease family)
MTDQPLEVPATLGQDAHRADAIGMSSPDRSPGLRGLSELLGFFVLHVAVWIGLMRPLAGEDFVDYVDLGSADTPWVRQFIVGLLVVLLLQVMYISQRRCWKPLLTDETPLRAWWVFLLIGLVAFAGAGRFAADGLSAAPSGWWVGFTVTMLLVGLTEEITFRGILLVGGRQLLGTETRALLFSSALFGLFHLPNALIGQSLGASVVQVFATAIIGSVLYLVRRSSRSLLVAALFHAAYDWALLQGAFS